MAWNHIGLEVGTYKRTALHFFARADYHHFSDVLCGAVLGFGTCLMCAYLLLRLGPNHRDAELRRCVFDFLHILCLCFFLVFGYGLPVDADACIFFFYFFVSVVSGLWHPCCRPVIAFRRMCVW